MTDTPGDIRAELVKVLAANADARRCQNEARFASMTERERGIFKDAAVAGFVEGTQRGHIGPDETFPKDSTIVYAVLSVIESFPDLYRTVSGYVGDDDA